MERQPHKQLPLGRVSDDYMGEKHEHAVPTFCIRTVLLLSRVGTSVPSGADTMPATGCPCMLVSICVALAGRLSTLSTALVMFLLPRWAPLCIADACMNSMQHMRITRQRLVHARHPSSLSLVQLEEYLHSSGTTDQPHNRGRQKKFQCKLLCRPGA